MIRASGKYESPPESDELEMLLFLDTYGYKEQEGPFVGYPTVLAAASQSNEAGWQLVRIETNAGYRELYCREICFGPQRSVG